MVNKYQVTEKMQVIGRFMSCQHEFHGLRNYADMEYCLKLYDEAMEYPKESGWTYTRYYAPDAFQLGWRLYKDAKCLWEVFSEVRERSKLPIKEEVPMEYFTRTVEYLLTETVQQAHDFQGFTASQFKNAVLETGYVEGSRYLLHPKKDNQ
jgi:hypothetical protein